MIVNHPEPERISGSLSSILKVLYQMVSLFRRGFNLFCLERCTGHMFEYLSLKSILSGTEIKKFKELPFLVRHSISSEIVLYSVRRKRDLERIQAHRRR